MERQAEDLSRRVRVAQLERNRAVFVWLHNRQTDRLVHVNRDHCDLDVPRHGGESQNLGDVLDSDRAPTLVEWHAEWTPL